MLDTNFVFKNIIKMASIKTYYFSSWLEFEFKIFN
jgi:hypothetical protein